MLISPAFPGLRNPPNFSSDKLMRKYFTFKRTCSFGYNNLLQNHYSEAEQINTSVWDTTT